MGRFYTHAVTSFTALCAMSATASTPVEMVGDFGQYPMNRDGSGTSWVPDSTPMDGLHAVVGDWLTMTHGSITLAQTQQDLPRGGSATFSESMLMVAGRRSLNDGSALTLRAMISAEPMNGAAGYPLLFQTGESADGHTPLVDRQHPHNLFMELAAAYSRTLIGVASWFVYAAPVGEPALGPPAFLHRRASEDNPEAPLSHHHIDSTHISFGVVTGGLIVGRWKLETSLFNGREPDQHRSDIELRSFDSWSTRLSFNPRSDLAIQVSTGHLSSPEALNPSLSTTRTTASVLYEGSIRGARASSTVAFGRNTPSSGSATDAWLVDESLRLGERHTVFGRYERVGLDELPGIQGGTPLSVVSKASLGYQYDFARLGAARFSLGGMVSHHWVPDELVASYGTSANSWTVYLRARIAP